VSCASGIALLFTVERSHYINTFHRVLRTRGDGFPLAAMFASVSTHCDELGPLLEAHLYTVCPTAIPTLSMATAEGDENALMESLGMIKDKSGEFESFDKFLHRTEVRRWHLVRVGACWCSFVSSQSLLLCSGSHIHHG
jgi:hypothetical protein